MVASATERPSVAWSQTTQTANWSAGSGTPGATHTRPSSSATARKAGITGAESQKVFAGPSGTTTARAMRRSPASAGICRIPVFHENP